MFNWKIVDGTNESSQTNKQNCILSVLHEQSDFHAMVGEKKSSGTNRQVNLGLGM